MMSRTVEVRDRRLNCGPSAAAAPLSGGTEPSFGRTSSFPEVGVSYPTTSTRTVTAPSVGGTLLLRSGALGGDGGDGGAGPEYEHQ